jgi:hypothetical protein
MNMDSSMWGSLGLLAGIIGTSLYLQPPVNEGLQVSTKTTAESVTVTARQFDRSIHKATFYLDGKPYYHAVESRLLPDNQGLKNGIVTLMFDDGWLDVFTKAYPILESYGAAASIAVIQDYVDKPGALSSRHINRLIDSGWDIVSHTLSDVPLTSMGQAQAEFSMRESRRYLWQNFWGVDTIAFPFGAANSQLMDYSRTLYLSSRLYSNGNNQVPINPHGVIVRSLEEETSPAEIYSWIEEAAARRQWLVFAFHHVVEETAGQYTVSPDFLRTLLEKMRENNLEVLPYSQALQASVENYAGVDGNTATWIIPAEVLSPGRHTITVEVDGAFAPTREFHL